jgi:EAL domain-containing protein (putative c-di-GMP-specific phosphodiesterase class I)
MFPVEMLKIDRSFVSGLSGLTGLSDAEERADERADERVDEAIVTMIVALARALGLTVVAEGVETRPQLARLAELGCGIAQGHLFGRPVPAPEVALEGAVAVG